MDIQWPLWVRFFSMFFAGFCIAKLFPDNIVQQLWMLGIVFSIYIRITLHEIEEKK